MNSNKILFTEEQLNLNNWTKNSAAFTEFFNTYKDGVNSLVYKGGAGYERIYTAINVEKNTDYEICIRFTSDSGFHFGGYGAMTEQFFVTTYVPSQNEDYTTIGTKLAISDELDKSASDIPKDYKMSFNSGNYTKLYVSIDFGQIKDDEFASFIISIPFDLVKYLIRDGETIYTVSDNTLVEVSGEINSNLFIDNGVDAIPDGTLLMTLSNPEVLCWTDAETLPTLTATVKGIPPQPQVIVSEEINLMDGSIKGIESVTIDCKGEPAFAVSFDKKVTCIMHNGTDWVNVADEATGMTKTEFEAITTEQWQEQYEASSEMYIRCTLLDETQSVTTITIDFIN